MSKTKLTEEEVWDQFMEFYKSRRIEELEKTDDYQVTKMKSLEDLLKDYFSDGADGHVCSLEEIPKYFVYDGNEYAVDFKVLDQAHAKLMEHRQEEGLIGELSQMEALELFKDMATSQEPKNPVLHTDVDRDGILGERFYHKFQFMMQNWEDEDKQFNLALGNFEEMN